MASQTPLVALLTLVEVLVEGGLVYNESIITDVYDSPILIHSVNFQSLNQVNESIITDINVPTSKSVDEGMPGITPPPVITEVRNQVNESVISDIFDPSSDGIDIIVPGMKPPLVISLTLRRADYVHNDTIISDINVPKM